MRAKFPLILCLLVLSQMAAFSQTDRRRTTYSLVGSVMLEDGSPVKEPAEVILTCSGAVLQRTETDGRGQFSFRLGDPKSPDTSNLEMAGSPSGEIFKSFNQMGRGLGDSGQYGSGRSRDGRLNLSDCELSALLPGYSSEIIYPGVIEVLENPDIGTIILRSRAKAETATVSVTKLKAPKEAVEALEAAREKLGFSQPDFEGARRKLEEAVEIYPGYADAWLELGDACSSSGDAAQAIQAYEKAVEADPGFALAYVRLTEINLQRGEREAAAQWSLKAVEISPEDPRACYLFAFARFGIGDFERAEQYARQVQNSESAAAYPGTHYLLGSVLSRRREYEEAAREWREFLALSPDFQDAESLRRKLRVWEKMGVIEASSEAGSKR